MIWCVGFWEKINTWLDYICSEKRFARCVCLSICRSLGEQRIVAEEYHVAWAAAEVWCGERESVGEGTTSAAVDMSESRRAYIVIFFLFLTKKYIHGKEHNKIWSLCVTETNNFIYRVVHIENNHPYSCLRPYRFRTKAAATYECHTNAYESDSF